MQKVGNLKTGEGCEEQTKRQRLTCKLTSPPHAVNGSAWWIPNIRHRASRCSLLGTTDPKQTLSIDEPSQAVQKRLTGWLNRSVSIEARQTRKGARNLQGRHVLHERVT